MDIDKLLGRMAELEASDLHIQAGSRVMFRIHGELAPAKAPPLTPDQVRDVIQAVCPKHLWQDVEQGKAADFAYHLSDKFRFRVGVYHQRGAMGAVFRILPLDIPSVDALGLPAVLLQIADTERGLVLVTGTTGSGKSTTLAAMIDYINQRKKRKIITIEDPIEFWHGDKSSLISQIELGADTPSFSEALRRALRQDPDVILVGELRDLQSMRTALTAADTGHLVFSTIHTTNASQTVERLIAMFPEAERPLLLAQLSANLAAVISMRLARRADGKGRVPVVEILRGNPTVRKLIAEGRYHTLPQAIASRESGMQMFDQAVVDLYNQELITGTETMRLASNPEAVAMALRGITSRDTSAGLVG